MRPNIIRGTSYRDFPLYEGIKASKGFNQSYLDKTLEIGNYAQEQYMKPLGFHLILEDPLQSKLGNVPDVISAWCGSAVFLQARELRPRCKTFHIHLHIVFDAGNCERPLQRVYTLMQRLQDSTQSTSVKFPKRVLKGKIKQIRTVDLETGEVSAIKQSCTNTPFHNLSIPEDYIDWFQRVSYICKVETKTTGLRYQFTCSNLKARKLHRDSKRLTQTVLETISASVKHRVGVDTTVSSRQPLKPCNRFQIDSCRARGLIDRASSSNPQLLNTSRNPLEAFRAVYSIWV